MKIFRNSLALILTPFLYAQAATPPQRPLGGQNDTFTLQAYARNVVLDVVVTDSHGAVVRDLRRDDFEILESGKPQRIVSFEIPGSNAVCAGVAIHSTADLDATSPRAPVTIIALDEINTTFDDMAFARYSLHKYLDTQPQRLAQPTMLVAVGLQRFTVLVDYMQDKSRLVVALDHHFAQYPWHLDSTWRSEQFSASFIALTQVAKATSGHEGHKSLIWVGRGFPTADPMVVKPSAWARLQKAIRRCVDELTEARITLYTIDPAGVPKANDPDDENPNDIDPFGGSVQFAALARATGGKAFFGRNDVNAEVASSVRESDSFYSITYAPRPQDASPTLFRSIEVRLRNPQLRAVAREGYYLNDVMENSAQGASTPDLAAEHKRSRFDLLAAASTTLIYDGLPISVQRVTGDPSRITVQVPSSSIPWKPGTTEMERTVQLDVLIQTFDRRDKPLARVVKEITATLPKSEGKDKTPSLYLHLGLPSSASATRLRVVVRVAGNGKIGASNLALQKRD